LLGNLSHWIMGHWVEHLGPAASSPRGFYAIYAVLSLLVLLSISGLLCLHALRREAGERGHLARISPAHDPAPEFQA
jgi:hypothetical protein